MGRMNRSGQKKPAGMRRCWLRHTLTLVLPLALVFVLAVTALFAVVCYGDAANELRICAQLTADRFSGGDLSACAEYASAHHLADMRMQLADPQGILLASGYGAEQGSAALGDDIARVLFSGEPSSELGRDADTGERVISAAHPLLDEQGKLIAVLRVIRPAAAVDRRVLLAAGISAVFGGIFLGALLLTGNFHIGSILQPLEDITSKARMIADGSYGARIQTPYGDEIGELAETINELSAQINQNEKTQTEFISSLSHELRTPLTAITGWGETLVSTDQLDPDQTRRGIRIILREATRLTEMVVELLDFTRIQDGRMTLNIEQTDIRSEFEDTLFMYGSRLQQEGIEIEYLENNEDIPEIPCDPKRMRQVFLNIFDNAAKHGGSGKRIDASICCRDDMVLICIRDYGPGIPEDELPLVKNKFYKGSSKARGSGIGLAVCDEILQRHGGWLELCNAPGGGTSVTVALPASR